MGHSTLAMTADRYGHLFLPPMTLRCSHRRARPYGRMRAGFGKPRAPAPADAQRTFDRLSDGFLPIRTIP